MKNVLRRLLETSGRWLILSFAVIFLSTHSWGGCLELNINEISGELFLSGLKHRKKTVHPSPPKLPQNFRWKGRYIVPDLDVNVPFTWLWIPEQNKQQTKKLRAVLKKQLVLIFIKNIYELIIIVLS